MSLLSSQQTMANLQEEEKVQRRDERDETDAILNDYLAARKRVHDIIFSKVNTGANKPQY